jgi:hypothetical protein
MQPVDKFMFGVGILWSLFTLYAIFLLFPRMDRMLREWEIKFGKGRTSIPSRLQRVVFILLTSLMTTVAFASAYHRKLDTVIGISSGTACCLMMILPGLYFALGRLNKRLKKRSGPEA